MKRRLLFIWGLFVLLLTPELVKAHDFEAINSYGDTLYYNVLSDTTCALTYKGTSYYSFDEYRDTVVVPSSVINEADGLTRQVTHLAYNALRQSSVKHLVLPEGLTTINGAIAGADSLKYIYVPSTLTTIQDGYLTSNLTSLEVIEWNVRQFINTTGKSLFQNTLPSRYNGLRKIIFGPDVEMIPANFCRSLSSLHTVVIPSNVNAIGNSAFYECDCLYEIYNQSMIPMEMGSSNYGNVSLNAKIIHSSLDEPSIFYYFPEWHVYLLNEELHVFRYMGTSYEVNMPPSFLINNREYKRYSIDGGTFYGGPASESVTSLTLSDSVAVLYNGALFNTRITSIVIPGALEKIYPNVFPYTLTSVTWNAVECRSPDDGYSSVLPAQLSSITFAHDVKVIPNYFLKGNQQILALSLPSSVEEIGKEAFSYCTSLIGSLVLPENLRSIGASAFLGCSGFSGSLTLPDKLTYIGPYAFNYTNFTGTLIIPESVDTLGNSVVGSPGITTIHYNAQNCKVLEAGRNEEKSPFFGCTRLNSIVFGDSVKVIPDFLCMNLSSITSSIAIPEYVEYIGNKTFMNTNINGTLVIPETLKTLGLSAFVGTGITTIHYNAQDCKVVSARLNEEPSPFYGCEQLSSIVFGDKVKVIPDYLCHNLSSLTSSLLLPHNVEIVGSYVFQNSSIVVGDTLIMPENLHFFGSSVLSVDDVDVLRIKSKKLNIDRNWHVGSLNASVHFDVSVDSIPESLFDNYDVIDSIYYDISAYKDGTMNEFNCLRDYTTKIGIGPSVRNIPNNLFAEFFHVEQVVLPATVENVGCGAFNSATELITEKNYGQTIRLDATSVDTWQNVYAYVESKDHFIDWSPAKPFGERPGKLLESPYEFSFPLDYCNGIKVEFSNGTAKSAFVEIPIEWDTVFCCLMAQTGTEIPMMLQGTGEDLLPEPTDAKIVLDDNGYTQMFNETMGDFVEFLKVKPYDLSNVWRMNNDNVSASGRINYSTTRISESWLLSPTFDCSQIEHLYLVFEHALAIKEDESITDITDYIGMKVTTDGATWIDVPLTTYPQIINYDDVYVQCIIDLDEFMSASTRFAFVYKSDMQNAPTWYVRNLTVNTTGQIVPEGDFGSMNVPIPVMTKLSDLFYDVNGDSIMEYVYMDDENSILSIYSYQGQLIDNIVLQLGMRLTAIDDIDRDGVPDFILYSDGYSARQVYIMPYDTKILRPLSDAKFSEYNFFFDANGDGRLDYYMDDYTRKSNGQKLNVTVADYIYIQQPDGSFVRTSIQTLTDEEEIINESFAQSGSNIVVPPPVRFSGAWLARAPRPRKAGGMQRAAQIGIPSYSVNSSIAVDVNRDGMPDMLNLYNENSLISLGEGRYYYGTLFGQVTVGDYNSDGIQDFIIFDPTSKTVYLYLYEGDNIYAKQILMQNMNISQVDAADIDNDGDLDIVLAFDWTEESQYAMLVVYRNDEGIFTKYEHAFGLNRKIHFYDMADVDGDSIYEMVCGEGGGYAPDNLPAAKYFLVKCTPEFTVEETVPFYYCKTKNMDDTNPWSDETPDFVMGDMNNDGYVEYWVSDKYCYVDDYESFRSESWWVDPYCGRFERESVNVSPEKMNTPTSILDAASGMLKVEWQAGSDAESSVCDLTYSVRVGSQPGLSDVMHGQATASGSRLRLGKGNVGTDLFTIFDIRNWSKGTYYIAVQAIDKEGLAGPWSDELVFEHSMLYAAFEMDHSRLFTADTLTLKLSTPYDPTLSYDWTLGDHATIVEESNGTWKVIFNRAEELDIQLRVSASDGSYADAVARHLVVMPLSWQIEYVESLEYSSTGTYFDVDLNGTLDVLGTAGAGTIGYTSGHTTGLHTNDGNNRFTKVPRSFNLDLDPGSTVLTDYNMDGFADFYSTSSKGDLFINSGYNNDFTYSTAGLQFVDGGNTLGYITCLVDIDRDGYPDMIENNGTLWVNAGDNLTFNEYELPSLPDDQWYSVIDWYDWDQDGWLDAIVGGEFGIVYWCRNLRDGSFASAQLICQIEREDLSFYYINVADIDGDGYGDFVFLDEERMDIGNDKTSLVILWGNPDGTFTEAIYDVSEEYYSLKRPLILDMDNNGYMDIAISEMVFCQIAHREFISVNDKDDENMAWSPEEKYFPFADLNGDSRPDCGDYVMSSRITNTAPMAPTNVKAVQDGGYVVLSWDDAYDAETPYHAMRYNVSVKKSGASGAGSYIISPMNGGSDIAAIAPQQYYYTLNRLEIPANRFTVGESYEVKVQSIDGWNAHSPFSETFTITIASEVSITAPSEACTGAPVTVSYSGTESGTPQWSSEGATVVADGVSADFTWTTPGVKTIACTVNGITSTRAITIAQGPDMSFSLPGRVLSSAYVYFTLPQAFADSRNHITYRHSYDPQQESAPLAQSWGMLAMPVINTDENGIEIERRGSSLDARMTAHVPDGDYWIEFVCQTESCGEITYRQNFTVDGDNVTPEISIVTIDAATGKNVINWQRPSNLPNSDLYSSVVVYREEGSTDKFVQLGETTIDAGQFVDMASEPSMRKYRYRIALKTNYGGISTPSAVHSSVHVMLNRGLTAGSVNIVWTPYEGGIIEQYTILRGSSPDNMQPLTTASGYEQSYTDFAVPEGDVYYALSYSNTYDNNWGTISAASVQQGIQRAPSAAVTTGRSNAVNANQSTNVTPATSLEIRHVESTLTLNQAQQAVHLYAEILPGSATYKTVNWQVTSGNDLATVSSTGLVTYIGNGANGTVTVQATTIDGSNLSKHVDIPVEGFSEIQEVTGVELSTNLYILSPTQNTTVIAAEVTPSNASDKSLTWSITSGSEIVTVSQSGVVTALGVNGTAIIRATANNGVYGEITITVQGFSDVQEVTEIVLSSDFLVLSPAQSTTLIVAVVNPEDATDQSLTWSVSFGSDIVTVNQSGVVTALGVNGSAVIRATANNGIYGEITVFVQGYGEETNVQATSFTLYATFDPLSTAFVNPTLTPALQTLYIKANIEPENATTKAFLLELLEGGEHVSVTNMGTYHIVQVIPPASDGVVKFRGSTLDGSNLTYSLDVVLSGFNTALEQVHQEAITVYPVPVRDIVFIDSESPIEQIRIFSSDGREVYASDGAVTAVNLAYLPSGVYHMEIRTTTGQLLNRKIIVQK